jgi:aconitate hydratase
MALRSNIPAISEYVSKPLDPGFVDRAKEKGGGFIIAGENYGQGSSREHAALAPMYIGIKAILAKSFARIQKANLINVGIPPLEFNNPKDYDYLETGDKIHIKDIVDKLSDDDSTVSICVNSRKISFNLPSSRRSRDILILGGLLNYTKKRHTV